MSIGLAQYAPPICEVARCDVAPARYTGRMNLSEMITSSRKAHGWSAREVARRANVSHAAVIRLEKGERLGRIDTVMRVADVLGIDPTVVDQLVRGTDVTISPDVDVPSATSAADLLRQAEAAFRRELEAAEARIIALEGQVHGTSTARGGPTVERVVGNVGASIARVVNVPIVTQVASAGAGSIVDAETVEYGTTDANAEYIAVRIAGTCLEPDVASGSLVIVDTSRKVGIATGSLVMATHNAEALVKWLEIRPDGSHWLVSNSEPPIRANGDTIINGVVVAVYQAPPMKQK